jgi:hypothetical protein
MLYVEATSMEKAANDSSVELKGVNPQQIIGCVAYHIFTGLTTTMLNFGLFL